MERAFFFDVFGTLVDWREGVAKNVRAAFQDRGQQIDAHAFADTWRGQYDPAMERIRSGDRGYVPLDVLHRENLNATLAEFDIEGAFDEEARDNLSRAWERLPPWPDVHEGLKKLGALGFVAPCSNASIALSVRLARFAGLCWDGIVGAEIAQSYKPAPEVYKASCSALGFAPENVIMVAAHNDDLAAASSVGLQTAFIPRPGEHGSAQTVDLTPAGNWTYVGQDLVDLAARIEMRD